MNVLVTGGAGFLGSWVVERLLAWDCDVTVWDTMATGSFGNLPVADDALTIRTFSVLHPSTWDHDGEDPDAVIHLAGTFDPRAEEYAPDAYFDLAVGAANLLKRFPRARFVLGSSLGDLLQAPEDGPIDVRWIPQPSTTLGAGYLAAEAVVRGNGWNQADWTIARMSYLYGERSRDVPSEPNTLGLYAATVAAQRSLRIEGDGGQAFDFLHAEDAAEALVQAALGFAGRFRTLALVSGEPVTIRELVEWGREVGSLHAEFKGGARPLSRVYEEPDNGVLKWEPRGREFLRSWWRGRVGALSSR